ncbi:MAG TPA: DUF4175 family protein, partial [Acidisoma sp.]|nr:DUF4175 family protein [Acidisoma sp.]
MAIQDRGRGRLNRATLLPRRLIRALKAARIVLIFEAVWPALWPSIGVLALYLCAALLDLPQRLGGRAQALLLVADVAAALATLGLSLARIRWPDERDAQGRLNRASGFKHDPITTLLDSPAQMDLAAHLLWRAHRARTLAETRQLRLGLPWPWRARPSALAFRGGIIVALVLCVWAAGPMARSRLAAGFTVNPAALLGATAAPPSVTAWVTPPAYTGRPPVLLPVHETTLTVPLGSHLTVTVAGLSRAPRLDGLAGAFHQMDAESFQLEARLDGSGLYTLRARGARLAWWQIMVQPDSPPSIGFAGRPGPDADGYSLRLPWHASDDYAVVSARLTAHLIGKPSAPALTLPLALPAGPGAVVEGVQVTDLSANPWAGLPVSMQLQARDAAGQSGLSPVETVVLPERHFTDAYARRVIAIRKGLVEMPDAADRRQRVPAVRAILDTAAAATVDGKQPRATLPLFAAGWELLYGHDSGAVDDAIGTLWQVALHFEQGDAADTGQSLMQAERALQNALQGNHASAAELSRLMQRMQSAILQHLSTLMQMAQHQGSTVQAGSPGRPFDLSSLARQLQAMEAAAKAGDAAAMRQALASLQQSLQQLAEARIVQPDPKQEAARAQAE